MTQYERELSNLSYTNKDFGVIYPELLDLAKKISYKWDPSTSDESDPGVVLLKLVALIADKNNYNIDKNALELFPLSVTQEANAREIYDQCGYTMRYYQSAKTKIELTIQSEPEITDDDKSVLDPNGELTESDWDSDLYRRVYTLPIFTTVSDTDNNIIYTIEEEVILKTDGVTKSVNAIQGIPVEYSINGETLITASNLDYNNRLYFTETDIAENGIYIKNNTYGYDQWNPVDNLQIQPLGTPCYKFGVAPDGSGCYIEFPSDIENIIGSGLQITYIRTRGIEGNIGRKRINQFYIDTNASRRLITSNTNIQHDVTVTNENIYIINPFAATNGKNPETIDEAYRNYQKVKNTFETLVSLRDYNNYITTNKSVSNGFVCDRTNDIQSTYKIAQVTDDYMETHTVVIEDDNENPLMNAFNLRIYALNYVDQVTNNLTYEKTFTIVTESPNSNGTLYSREFNELKSIQHDFKDYEEDEIIMLKNKYPIVTNIIPQYKLDNLQQESVKEKVVTALYNAVNAKQVTFGEGADYDLIYDTILNADPRIKAVSLDDIKYTTYAVFQHSGEIFEIRISSEFDENGNESEGEYPEFMYFKTKDKNPVEGKKYYTVQINKDEIEYVESSITDGFLINVSYYEQFNSGELRQKFRNQIYTRSVLAGNTQLLEDDNTFTYSTIQSESATIHKVYSIITNSHINVELKNNNDSGVLIGDSAELTENENVVFTTPNLIKDQDYSSYVKFIHNIGQSKYDENDNPIVVNKDAEYSLKEDEFIIFFWKEDESDDSPYTYYKYSGKEVNTSGLNSEQITDKRLNKVKIISPTFSMRPQDPTPDPYLKDSPIPFSTLELWPDGKGSTSSQANFGSISATNYISKLQGSQYVLTGSNTITTKKSNSVHVNNTISGNPHVCWILNDVDTETKTTTLFDSASIIAELDSSKDIETNKKSLEEAINNYNDLYNRKIYIDTVIDVETGKYRLAEEYELKNGEYFFYTNVSKTQLLQLGSGTKITRYCDITGKVDYKSQIDNQGSSTSMYVWELNKWQCVELDLIELISSNIEYLSDKWYSIPDGSQIISTEMRFEQIGPGYKISLQRDLSKEDIEFNKDTVIKVDIHNVDTSLANYRISYIDPEGNTTTLPDRNDASSAWSARSILNIESSKVSPQKIRDNQIIELYDQDRKLITTLLTEDSEWIDKDSTYRTNTQYILTDSSVNYTGGIHVNTVKYDNDKLEYVPLSIFTYSTIQSESSKYITDKFNIIIPIYKNWNNTEIVIPISIPSGDYILPIKNIDSFDSNYAVLINDIDITDKCINGEIKEHGVRYLKLNIPTITDNQSKTNIQTHTVNTLKIRLPNQVLEDNEINILTPYKYSNTNAFENENSIGNLVSKADILNVFNYTNVVSDEYRLEEHPLTANSFNKSNHPYNKFTIPQWVTTKDFGTLIKVINKIK